MMKQIVDNLRGQEYINAENIEALRKYIRVKNPNSSREELSVIFADALHKIIDTRIYQFEEKYRKKIKDDVLKKAIKKKEFSINAAEVFSSCLAIKLYEDSYIDGLTQWINQSQPIPVSAEKVNKLVLSLEQLEKEYIENNIDDIVDEFETVRVENEMLPVIDMEITEVSEPDIYEEVLHETYDQYAVLEDDALGLGEAAVCQSADESGMSETQGVNLEKLSGSIYGFIAFALSNIRSVRPSMKLVLPAALPLIIIAVFAFTNLFSGKETSFFRGEYSNTSNISNISNVSSISDISGEQLARYMSSEFRVTKELDDYKGKKNLVLSNSLDEELKYKEVNVIRLKSWLDKKNSMLAEEPYLTAILSTSEQYDIHPLLMFAIIGQEQAFVPKSGTDARKIANNPFNVYGSWEKYNTDIYDSSRLAAGVIIKARNNRPVHINTIKWINRRYSKDPNWCNGVSSLFAQMEKEIIGQK